MNYHYYYFLNILFAFFAFAPPPLRTFSSATDDGFGLCNVKNGQIFVENKCQKLLLCYQSNLANGNAKIGRHFRAKKGTNGKENFTECAEEMKGKEWHGLSIFRDEYGKIRFESSLGFDGIFGTNQIEQMENHMEIDMDKFFEPFRMELQNALSFGPFFGEFREMIMAFDFVSPICGQNVTTKLCKTKCFSQSMASHGLNLDHFGKLCTEIIFPMEIDKFILNITASFYKIACDKYEKRFKFGEPEPPDEYWTAQRYVNACMKVPTAKCEKHVEFYGCYKTIKNWPSKNNYIAELCQKHLSASNVAGFAVQICVQRNQFDQQKLIVEAFFNSSLSDQPFKINHSFTISMDGITEIKRRTRIFIIEFGTDKEKSAIREKENGKNIIGKWNIKNDGIGSVLNDILPETTVNGTLAKVIHFVPPENDDQMITFFQILKPKFSKIISRKIYSKGYKDDPDKFNRPTMCDRYGDDCEPIRNLLLKIEKLENCGKEDKIDESAFMAQDWAPMPPKRIIPKPSESLLCDGDLICHKETLQKQYNNLRKECGLKPEENDEANRRKRQFRPDCLDMSNQTNCGNMGKWTEFPIKIGFNITELPEKYHIWENAIKVGAELIMELTCVRFEFVDEMEDGKDGIAIGDVSFIGQIFEEFFGTRFIRYTNQFCPFFFVCGESAVGKIGGWQQLGLSMNDQECHKDFNMSVVAGHEILHALGQQHEQSRSDARNFVLLRKKTNSQSEIINDTQNFGFDYDFGSVLHYGAGGNHENNIYNLITFPRFYQQTIGQRGRISFKDAAIINRIYCNDSCKGHEDKCQNGGYLNPNDCAKCHCPDGYGGQYCDQLEENLNCVDVSGIPRELKANKTTTELKPKTKCTANDQSKCQCNWRIKPEAGKKARIQFKSLNDDLFKCTYNCSEAYVEVKYRADKRAQGAKLCCPDAFGDTMPNEYKNWIEAEKPDSDIVISAHLSSNWTEPIIPFELTFESGDVKLTNSCKCVTSENLYYEERNPETGTLVCTHENGTEYDCSCYGDKKCLTEEKWCHDNFMCQIIKVNGIQVKRVRQWKIKDPNDLRFNWPQIDIECYKAEGSTVSFWGYQEPGTTEIIRVDEIHCLYYHVAGVTPPAWFKSVGIENGQQKDKSEQNLYHGNVSLLPFIHAPKSVFDP